MDSLIKVVLVFSISSIVRCIIQCKSIDIYSSFPTIILYVYKKDNTQYYTYSFYVKFTKLNPLKSLVGTNAMKKTMLPKGEKCILASNVYHTDNQMCLDPFIYHFILHIFLLTLTMVCFVIVHYIVVILYKSLYGIQYMYIYVLHTYDTPIMIKCIFCIIWGRNFKMKILYNNILPYLANNSNRIYK